MDSSFYRTIRRQGIHLMASIIVRGALDPIRTCLFFLLFCSPCIAEVSFEYSLSGEGSLIGAPGTSQEFRLEVWVNVSALDEGEGGAEAISLGILAEGCSILDLALDPTTLDPAELFLLHQEFKETDAIIAASVDRSFSPLFSG